MKILRKVLPLCLLVLLLAACTFSAAPTVTPLPSATHTLAATATNTPAPTETPTPEPSPTETPAPTATNTLIPFPGFSHLFEFNKAWIANNQTFFYFLNSQVNMNVYGIIAGEYPFACSPDPMYPNHMECSCDFTDWKMPNLEFVFYADEAHTQEVDRRTFFTGLSDEARGIPEFAEYLANERTDEFTKTLNRKLLGYALGRSLQLSDQPLLESVQEKLKQNGGRFGTLIETIVLSPQFRQQRCRDFDPAAFRLARVSQKTALPEPAPPGAKP